MLNKIIVILAIGCAELSRLSGFSLVACGREIGLGVGPIMLMDVIIFSDRPITIVLDRNMYNDIVVTTDHSVAL